MYILIVVIFISLRLQTVLFHYSNEHHVVFDAFNCVLNRIIVFN